MLNLFFNFFSKYRLFFYFILFLLISLFLIFLCFYNVKMENNFYLNCSLIEYNSIFFYNFFLYFYFYLNPELIMLFFIFLFLIYCVIYSSSDSHFNIIVSFFSILIILCSFLLVYFFSFNIFFFDSFFDSFYYIRNDYNSIIELFILFISFFVFFFTFSYNKQIGIYSFEYYIIMLFCICSFCVFVHCNNLIFLYILIELQSIGSYILTSINRKNRYSIEAGLKYFVIGSFSSILILFGFSFLYGFSGLICFDDLSLYIRYIYSVEDSFLFHSLLFSFIFFNVGFLFKIYAAPFHFWVSDIYQGSPTSVTMFLSTIPVVSYIYVFLKLYICLFSDFFFFYSYILYFFSISSMLFGVFGALIQRKIKKLIAYSSISTVGYILAGLSGDTLILVQYCLFYLFVYIFNIIPIFIFLLNYRINNKFCLDNVRSFSSLFHQNSFLFFFFISFFFSLAGIPPFSGFVSKFFLFSSFGYSSLYSLLLFSLITSIISCYYYLRIIKMIYYDKNASFFYSKLTYSTCFVIIYFFFFNLFLLFFSSFFDDLCFYISLSLYSF